MAVKSRENALVLGFIHILNTVQLPDRNIQNGTFSVKNGI